MAANPTFPPFPEPPESPSSFSMAEGITAATQLSTGTPPSGRADNRRSAFRSPVEAARSVGLMLIDPAGEAATPWIVADILDLSCTGLCLLFFERPESRFTAQPRVRLNVSIHPDFGLPELGGTLRWFVRAGFEHMVTLGVQFDEELSRLPSLMPCRRSQPRVLGQ